MHSPLIASVSVQGAFGEVCGWQKDAAVRACIEKQEAASAISVLGFHGLAPLSQ